MQKQDPSVHSEIEDVQNAVTTLDDAVNRSPESIMTSELSIPDISESNDHIYPWERQPEEDDNAWNAFRFYRDLGPSRTFTQAIAGLKTRYYADPDYKPSVHAIASRSSRGQWPERVLAFDKEQDRLYQIARGIAIREMADRHEGIIVEAIGSLMVPIQALQLAMENDEDFIKSLSKTDAKKLISLSNIAARTIPSLMQAERLARGMPTEIVGGVIEHQVTHTMERDRIGEVLAVLDRSGSLDDRRGSLDSGEIVDAEVVEVHSVPTEGDD